MISSAKCIFGLRSHIIYKLGQRSFSNQNNSFVNLKNLRSNIDREPSYVRKNNEQIGQQLIFNIQNSKWGFVKKFLLIININELESWFLMRKIAKAVNNSCNGLSIQSMSKEQIIDLLSVLVLLRFEPKKVKVGSFKGRPNQFDDSTAFITELQAHIKEISINNDQTYFFQLSRKLLHTNSLLFLSKREQFQKKVLHKLQILMENKSLLNDILVRGCISNYWTKEFKQQLLNRNIPGGYVKALHFEDLQNPTKIEKVQGEHKIKTQDEIMKILEGFGYVVEENVLINGYEVDFLINNRLVVEYNGHHHYIINSKKLFPTAKDRWKQTVLRRRNFIISSVPFSQWRTFKIFEQKRKYIVQKIQRDWLRQYQHSKQQAK